MASQIKQMKEALIGEVLSFAELEKHMLTYGFSLIEETEDSQNRNR